MAVNKARPPQSPPKAQAENKARPIQQLPDDFRIHEESGDKFYIPPELIPDGMSYEWKALTVLGQEQRRHLIDLTKAGWTYVPRTRHAEDIPSDSMVPAGFDECIVVDGLVLMERPKVVTEAYREHMNNRAREMISNQAQRLKLVPDGTMGGQRPGEGRTVRLNRERDLSVPSDAGGD